MTEEKYPSRRELHGRKGRNAKEDLPTNPEELTTTSTNDDTNDDKTNIETADIRDEENNRKSSRNRRTASRKKVHKKKKSRLKGCLGIFLMLLVIVVAAIFLMAINFAQRISQSPSQEYSVSVEHVLKRDEAVDLAEQTPFSVLLMGVDTGELGRTEVGRSDVMVLATINPQTNTTTLTSIPRDTLTEIAGYGEQDKINHAYAFGGPQMAMNTVQNLLDIPVDHYVTVNMGGFEQIIDAVGGITITPETSFSQDGYEFVAGQPTHMDGAMALAYQRNRYDSGGDYSRQGRTRQIITAIIDSALSFDSIFNFAGIYQSLGDNLTTDLSLNELIQIAQNYRSAVDTIEQYQLSGEGQMIDGVYYEILDPVNTANVAAELKSQLQLDE